MICYNCGKPLDADSKFCSECGTENLVTEEELAIDKEIAKKSKREKKPLKDPKKTAIVALVLSVAATELPVVVGLALAIIALVFAIRVLKESENTVALRFAKIAKIVSIVAMVWSCVATVMALLAVIVWFILAVFYTVLWVVALIATFLFTDLGAVLYSLLGILI